MTNPEIRKANKYSGIQAVFLLLSSSAYTTMMNESS